MKGAHFPQWGDGLFVHWGAIKGNVVGGQFDNGEGLKFCEECGTRMGVSFPSSLPVDTKFRGECGAEYVEIEALQSEG